MTHRLVLDLLGQPFAVETPDADLAAEVRRLWAPALTADDRATTATHLTPVDGGWRVGPPAAAPVTVPSADEALLHLATVLNHRALDGVDALAVHAGVVQIDGRSAAVVASSGTGKSTLVAALLRAGAEYVSDEALVVDRSTTRLVGYPRPLGLSPWSCAAVGLPDRVGPLMEVLVSPAELGAVAQGEPGPLTLVVELTHPQGGPPSVEPMSRQAGAALLLRYAFNHWRSPADSFLAAHRLAAGVEVLHLTPGTPAATAELLLQLMRAQPAAATQDR